MITEELMKGEHPSTPLTEDNNENIKDENINDFDILSYRISHNNRFSLPPITPLRTNILNTNKFNSRAKLSLTCPFSIFPSVIDPLYHGGKFSSGHVNGTRKLEYYQSVAFRESSGPIIDIAVDDYPSYFGVSCMVASATCSDSQYNRPGELLSISMQDSAPIECMVMNGHYYHYYSNSNDNINNYHASNGRNVRRNNSNNENNMINRNNNINRTGNGRNHATNENVMINRNGSNSGGSGNINNNSNNNNNDGNNPTSNEECGDRATTTCITFNPSSKLFFSGGYDGSVAIWDPTFPTPRARIDEGEGTNDHINTIVSHPYLNMGMFGTSTGQVKGFKFSNMEFNDITIDLLMKKPFTSRKYVNTIETMKFDTTNNYLYVGTGMTADVHLKGGQIDCLDLGSGGKIINSKNIARALTDIEYIPKLDIVLIGTGELYDSRKGAGYIELWSHLLKGNRVGRDRIYTQLYDIHQIKSCPNNENYVIISDTTSVGKVYDLRNYEKSLLNISHHVDKLADQEGMVCHWINNTKLLTGGADGKLKNWDILSGNPLIDTKCLDSPISAITSGIDHMTLWIGTVSGGIHLFLPNKALDKYFKNNLEVIF